MVAIGEIRDRHVVSLGAPILSSRGDHQVIGRLAANVTYDRGIRDQINPDRPLTSNAIGRRGGLVEELHDRGSIEPRSQRDRAAIGELQQRNRLQTIGRRPTSDQDDDCGPIAARSWPDRAEISGLFEAKFKLLPRGFEATKPCKGNRLNDA